MATSPYVTVNDRADLMHGQNSSNVTFKEKYIFAPADLTTKVAILCTLVVSGIAGAIANLLLLFVVERRRLQQKCKAVGLFRRGLIMNLTKNLALSNFVTAVVAIPVNCAQLFVDLYGTTWQCRGTRVPIHALGCITVINLLLIAIERYCAIFHPYSIPSKSFTKKLLVLSWFVGGLVGSMQVMTLDAVRFDLTPFLFTVSCIPVRDTGFQKFLSTSFTVIIFVIPCLAFIYIAITVSIFIKKRRRKVQVGGGVYLNKSQVWRLKDTKMCINIIFTFFIPYIFYVCYGVVIKMIVKPQESFYTDYTIRRVQGVLVLANSAITPLVCFHGSREFRETAMKLITRYYRKEKKYKPDIQATTCTKQPSTNIDNFQETAL